MKAAVIGLGKSKKFFDPNGYDFTIGVNDIYDFFDTDYLVVVDHPHRFTKERLETIRSSRPKKFYSQIMGYNDLPNFTPILISHQASIKDKLIQCSNNSTHVATVLAYKLGATEIHLHGVDFSSDHKYFKNDGARRKAVERFGTLAKELEQEGIILKVGHASSQLSSVLKVVKV